MDLLLSDDQRLLKESAEKYLRRSGGPKRARSLAGKDDGFERDRMREMGSLGWFGILVSGDLGGLDLGPFDLALILELAGRALVPEPLGCSALAAMALAQSENAEARRALLDPVMCGEAIVIPALLEGPSATDVSSPATLATIEHQKVLLNGAKHFVPAATVADGFLVSARHADGGVLCYVPRRADGLRIEPVATVDGRPLATLEFRNTSAEHLVAGPQHASDLFERLYDLALIAASAELLGVMCGAIEMTLEYMKTRRQFSRPIGSFQALQHRAVDNYILTESTRSLLYQTCEHHRSLSSSMASALKSFASDAALAVTKSSIQLHGAIGFTDECDIGLYLKRAMWLSAQLGNAAAHRRRYASLC